MMTMYRLPLPLEVIMGNRHNDRENLCRENRTGHKGRPGGLSRGGARKLEAKKNSRIGRVLKKSGKEPEVTLRKNKDD